MLVLGLETSCDETGASVVKDGKTILSNVLASSADIHEKYGGIVPEIASRRQIAVIVPVLNEALSGAGVSLDDIDGIAVTQGPGLIGSLLVGLNMAKAISLSRNIPFVGVSHLEAHLWAVFLDHKKVSFPFLGLLVSGGHTSLYRVSGVGRYSSIGDTRDDAAGEAFDKVAMAMELGYPGGPVIDAMAARGDPETVKFPRSRIRGHPLDFSFSGIKTAVVQYVMERKKEGAGKFSQEEICDICASFQEAVVDMLLEKTFLAAEHIKAQEIVMGGGVTANSRVRSKFMERAAETGQRVIFPSPHLCTDNGAMVAGLGYHYLTAGRSDSLDLDAYAS